MNRSFVVAFALIASLLVATAIPAAASHGPIIVSNHTTDTEFNNAQTLDNVTVTGSGEDAVVTLTGSSTTEYNIVDDSGDGVAEQERLVAGDSSSNTEFHSEFKFVPNSNGEISTITGTATTVNNDPTGPTIDVYAVQENPDETYGEGTLVKSNWSAPTSTGEFTIDLDTDISVTAGANWTLEFVTTSNSDGTHDNFFVGTDEDSGLTEWYSRSGDGTADAGGNFTFTIIDKVETGTYISQNHTVEGSVGGEVNITEIQNGSVTATFEGWNGSSWTQLNQTTGITTTGVHEFSWTKFTDSDTVRTNVTVINGSSSGPVQFTMSEEGVKADTSAPTVNNSSASPTGELTTTTPTLEIDVNDSDFSKAHSDQVQVEFFVDGSSVGTDTLTSNGTASVTVSNDLTGGDHTWNATATDDYGHSQQSQTFDISVPGNLTFRNESNPSEMVDVNVQVTFIGSDTIVERNGTQNVSLDGLPVDEKMIVVVEADGWSDRTIILEDIFDQSDVYLLNESLTTTTTIFTVEDRTGLFTTGDAELVVERIINQSGSPEWRRIQAEKATSAGIAVQMERDERYRLKIRSDDGSAVSDLGHITASSDFDGATVNLIVTSTDADLTEVGGLYAWNATYEERDSASDRIRFDFTVEDSDFVADDVRVTIYERGNETNEIYNQSQGDGVTDLTVFQSVPDDGKTWVVEWSATIDGEEYQATRLVGVESLGEGFCGGDIDQDWCERGAIGGMFLIAGLFSTFNIGAGAFVLASYAGVAWYFGMLPNSIGAGAILLAAALSIGWVFAKGGLP